jgi:hypothetical protein
MPQTDTEFMEWLEGHEEWYEAQSNRWGALLTTCKVLALSASIISIVVAAAVDPKNFDSYGRWLIVAASALTAISTEMLSQLKVREMEALREYGNIEASAIVAHARQKFTEYAGDEKMMSKLKDDIRGRIHDLEEKQHRDHVFIESKASTKIKRRNSAA